jgi:tetratricopeptide (TPR) repeat protein
MKRTIELAPLDPWVRWSYGALGWLALQQGEPHRAADWYRRAVNVFDADGRIWWEYAIALYAAARYQDAVAAADEGLELIREGIHFDLLVATKAQSLVALGDVDQARRIVDDLAPATALKIYALFAVGDNEEIRVWLREFGSGRATPMQMAIAHIALGDADSALRWLHRMIDVRELGTIWMLRGHPGLDPLRRDSRWPLVMAHLEREEAKGAAGVLYEGPPDTPAVDAASR